MSSPPELRIDPLTGQKVILAPARADRPLDFEPQETDEQGLDENCSFCEGHEEKTPAEISALRPGSGKPNTPGWKVRVVPNKYPVLLPDRTDTPQVADSGEPRDHLGPSAARSEPNFFGGGSAHGAHEVIVQSPQHLTSIADLSLEQLALCIDVWRERMQANAGSAYSHLIVNEGATGGASLTHTHAQLVALPFVPPKPARERERFTAHFERSQGGCLLCDLLQEEVRRDERIVAIDDDTVLLAPFASQLPFQLQIVPRKHQQQFEESEVAMDGVLMEALRRLSDTLGARPPLNLWIRTAPQGATHFHWHLDVVPRLTTLAGVELGAGTAVNIYPPERAAAELKQ